MYTKVAFLVFSFCFIGTPVASFICYACGFSSVDSDVSCLTITNSTRIVQCSMKYCTIMRQEFRDPAGVIVSFVRGCENSPDFLNHDVSDSTFRTYYRACTSNLCNIGDGVQNVVGGNLFPYPPYTGKNLFVPGSGSDGIHQMNILIIFISSLTVHLFL